MATLLVSCRGAPQEPSPPQPIVSPAPASAPKRAEPPPQRFRGEFAASPNAASETVLQRATIHFGGQRRGASLSIRKDVMRDGLDRHSVLVLRLDGSDEATVVAPERFLAEGLDARLRFREFAGALYLELHVRENSDFLDLMLYQVHDAGPPVKVLSEVLDASWEECGVRGEVALTPVHARADQLQISLRRALAPGRTRPSRERACANYRPGLRSQAYTRDGGCFRPPVPLYFSPFVARFTAEGPTCESSQCTREAPANELAADLVRRAGGGAIDFTIPSWWKPLGLSHDPALDLPWKTFELGQDCRVSFFGRELKVPTSYVHSHWPYEPADLTRSWIRSNCKLGTACRPPCPAPHLVNPAVCEPLVDDVSRGWTACGDVSRRRSRDQSMYFDAIALRVPQADGASAVFVATLACDRDLYGDAVLSFEHVLRRMVFRDGAPQDPAAGSGRREDAE